MRTFVFSWWALALRGLAGIVLGIAAFAYPGFTLALLVLFFAAYLFVDGVFGLIAGVRVRSWWLGIQGALGIIAGIVAWRWPHIVALVLVALTVVWALLTGAIEIGLALALRRFITGELMLIVGGIISIVFGIVLGLYAIFIPVVALTVLVYLIGAYAFLAGIVYLVLAFRLRSFGGKGFVATS
jgi:uncharacterized membrane protein HdeD (DUF308 family)